MNILKKITLFAAVSVAGCAGVVQPSQTIRFAGPKAELTIEKKGCELGNARYTDLSGKGSSGSFTKFIAVSDSGITAGQWYASCPAVVPFGSSACRISGPQRAYFECSNYHKFKYIQ